MPYVIFITFCLKSYMKRASSPASDAATYSCTTVKALKPEYRKATLHPLSKFQQFNVSILNHEVTGVRIC